MAAPARGKKSALVEQFISRLKHTKGEFAGRPFKLLPWQRRLIRDLYDTVDADGYRKYRFCYLEIPKKNGKTALGAALALWHLCADGEDAAEVYSVACDREQASILFRQAAEFVRGNPRLREACVVRDSYRRILYPRRNGVYQVLSSETPSKHGLNPSAVFFDELHAQQTDELWRVMTSGTHYARRQQLIFVMTTAGIYDVNSIWWRLRSKAVQIASGVVKQENFLPVLYIADPEADPHDPKLWRKVNPSCGEIFTIDTIRKDYEEAKADPVSWSDFLRFRLNIPVKHVSRWMPMQLWDACDHGPIDERALDGLRCYAGLDMSATSDLTSLVLVFPPQQDLDRWTVLVRAWCPADTIAARGRTDRVHYDAWARSGHIIAIPGAVIDESWIIRQIVADAQRYDIVELGYDPWMATQLVNRLTNEHGMTRIDSSGRAVSRCVEMRQGAKTLSEPAKTLYRLVAQRELSHGGHPVLRWCVDNLVMVPDANENIRPDKAKATERIDCAVALIMAIGRAMLHESTDGGGSVYDDEMPLVIDID